MPICLVCWSQEAISIDSMKANQVEVKQQKIYDVVSQMPRFPGGHEAMMQFITDSIRFYLPDEERGIPGRAIVRFVVDTIGQINDITILRSLTPACDKEAIRLVKSMPRWIPGEEDGVKVPVYFNLPISFRLKY